VLWLGEERGYLSDWITQRWVRATGRLVRLSEAPWLAGPVGRTRGIGREFFSELAREEGLAARREGDRGLLPSFALLAGPSFDPSRVAPEVADFYERTSRYAMDAWSEWCGAFRPFGRVLAALFSRRLQQLNVPLSGLDTSRGVTSDVCQWIDPASGAVRHTAWVRELAASREVVYAGAYSLCRVPGHDGPCVKVIFPLPNGNASVFLRPEAGADGSLTLWSSGRRFGDPGFYFTVRAAPGAAWARYLPTMRESIRVYPDRDGAVRTDHVLTIWRQPYLRLHYRLTPRPPSSL